MFNEAFELVSQIKALENGATAYIVGGAVRDYLLGRDCDDIDIATSVDIDTIEKNFEIYDIGKNKDFGIVVVKYKGYDFEVAQYRSDGSYSDGRHPDSVELGVTVYDDSCRRDFTINAMYMDSDKSIIDFHGGQEDLKNKVIRTVGNPIERFEEDYLRMMRAVRQSSVLDFKIEDNTFEAIFRLADKISCVAFERIWNEFLKMANGDNFAYGVDMLCISGMMRTVCPEINKMYFGEYPHYRKHHPEGSLRNHFIAVLKYLDNKPAIAKLGGLFHDIGKPVAYKYDEEKGKFHYFKHDYLGLAEFDRIASYLHIPNDMANEIRYCIKNHMKMHLFLTMKDSKCYDLIDSPYWDTLYTVAYADDSSRLYLFDREFWNKLDAKVERLKVILSRKKKMESIINGKFIMDTLSIEGSPKVGDVLKKTRDYVINNDLDIDNPDIFDKVKKYVNNFR